MAQRTQARKQGRGPGRRRDGRAPVAKLPVRSPVGQARSTIRRHPLISRIAHDLAVDCGVPAGSKIVLGVSGGADSLALLIACAAIRARRIPACEPVVVHVNHHLRRAAVADARHVARVCDTLDVAFEIADVHPRRESGNLADAARRLRYDALASAARRHQAGLVATAHHLDDQFETVLMNLCRGSDLRGLMGMPARRRLAAGVDLVRPMLGMRKSECESLCRAAGIQWREDPSNRNIRLARARIRKEVIPVLESLWPGAAERVCRSLQGVGLLNDAINSMTERAFGSPRMTSWRRAQLRREAPWVIAAGLHRAAVAIAGPDAAARLARDHLESAAEAIRAVVRQPRSFDWPGNLRCVVTSKEVRLEVRSGRQQRAHARLANSGG